MTPTPISDLGPALVRRAIQAQTGTLNSEHDAEQEVLRSWIDAYPTVVLDLLRHHPSSSDYTNDASELSVVGVALFLHLVQTEDLYPERARIEIAEALLRTEGWESLEQLAQETLLYVRRLALESPNLRTPEGDYRPGAPLLRAAAESVFHMVYGSQVR